MKLILCCSLPDIIPHIKFHLNWMKNTEVPIFDFWDPQNFFESSAIAKLSKLEPFAWSHWIRNCLNYLYCQCQHQPHSVHKMAQLPQIASSENWKPRFSSMSQKSKIVFDFFPIIISSSSARETRETIHVLRLSRFCIMGHRLCCRIALPVFFFSPSATSEFKAHLNFPT